MNLSDYYLVRRGRYSITDILAPNGGVYGRWGWRGLVAYFAGFVAMIPFFSTSLYTGPVATMLDGADIAFVVGLLVATTVYLLLMRSFDLQGEAVVVNAAPLTTGQLGAPVVGGPTNSSLRADDRPSPIR